MSETTVDVPVDPTAAVPVEAPAEAPADPAPAYEADPTLPTAAPSAEPEAPAPAGQHTLPSGGTVTFLDPADMTYGQRSKLLLAAVVDPGASQTAAGLAMQTAVTAAIITELTLPYEPGAPLPSVDISTLDKIRVGDLALIDKTTADAMAVIFPSFDPDPSEASPTQPSAA